MTPSTKTRGRRGIMLASLSGALATAALLSGTALAAGNPSLVTPVAAFAVGNSFNQPPNCMNKIEGASGVVTGSVNGAAYTISLVDLGNESSSFLVTDSSPTTDVVVSRATVKASTDVNSFDYSGQANGGVTGDTVFSQTKGGTTASDNGLDAAGNLLPTSQRHGLSHVCFDVATRGVLAVSLRSFTATSSSSGTSLSWRTASELDVAGYNLLALVHGQRVKLNAHLISSKGAGANLYRFNYRTPRGTTAPSRFWLQSVNLDGSRTLHAARLA